MNDNIPAVVFVKCTGKQQHPVQTGIKGPDVLRMIVLDGNAFKFFAPGISGQGDILLEGPFRQFLRQISFGLFRADEG